MKHLSFIYSNKAIKKAQKKATKKKYQTQLIQLFTALTDKQEIKKVLKKLTKKFPKAIIIGSTTAGEISKAKMYDNATVVSLSLFESTKLIATYVKNIDKNSGQNISKNISYKNTKAAIVISEGLKGYDYEGFIKGIKKQNPKLIIAGGLAGDNFNLKKTFVFLGDTIYENGAVAVSFSGKNLFAHSEYNLNWAPIGKEFTITKAKNNIVSEIDNISAVELFKNYLGDKIFDNNSASLPEFQLLYKEGTTVVARTPLATDKRALVFAGPIKSGQKVQFGFSNAATVVSGSNKISHNISKKPAQAIYIYSCIARKKLLGKTLENEFAAFENIAPSSGFFTYGEFYSTDENNALLNCTTTILVLSESSKKVKYTSTKKNIKQGNDSITFNALTHFIEKTSEELESNLRSLNQYKKIVDSASMISKTDSKGVITYVNDNFCKVSGYTKEELIGYNQNIVRNKKASPFIFQKMWQKLLSKKVWTGNIYNSTKSGSDYHINATIMPILNKDRSISGFISIQQDITKQVQSRKRLQEKEKLIRAVLDNQNGIVIHASKINGMQAVNQQLFEFFDYKNFNDFKERSECICDLFIPEEGYIDPKTTPDWLDIIANNHDKTYKVKMKIKDNTVHTFSLAIKRIDNDYIINLYDITDLEEALTKAYLSEHTKSIFLSNMSHEIRTPLNGILGFTDILSKRELDPDTKRYIDIINKSGQTLLNVVNDILDFSKLESGELSLHKVESNLFEEMEAAVATFSSLSKKNAIEYYTYIDPNIPKTLICDVQRLKQVLNNLISNAMKFTRTGGNVSVHISLDTLSTTDATLHFSVKDNGIGIAKEKLPTIFKEFSQADSSISREFGGTGLGLAISNRYINMMGANISVTSEEGEGSTFSFAIDLPIVNHKKSLEKTNITSDLKISILYSKESDICSVNENVAAYLSKWQSNFSAIYSLDEITMKSDILIVCAKLFDTKRCQNLLNTYPKLNILYIEGVDENMMCDNKRFHLIEQPMTGSSIYDKLISFSNVGSLYNKDINPKPELDNKFEGKVLIAEDNETNQMLISIMLEERNIEYKIVDNGQKAVDILRDSNDFNLVFMDINMPILDGINATKILRELGYSKPIVSLSANVIESDIKMYLESGIDATLNKPIVPKELDKILTTYLSKKKDLTLDFDNVDIFKMSELISIKDTKIVQKLLNSFKKSTTSFIERLEIEKLDKDILHTLKGMSGNLRFLKMYKLIQDFELHIEKWSEEENSTNKDILLAHLKDVNRQIELINK